LTHVATFRPHSTYPNQRLLFDDETFTIEGSGAVDVRHLTGFDSKGELDWVSADMRNWIYQRVGSTTSRATTAVPTVAIPTQGNEKSFYKRTWFILLVIVGMLLLMCFMCSVVGLLGSDNSSSNSVVDTPDNPAATEASEEPAEPEEEPIEDAPEVEAEEPEDTGHDIGKTFTVGEFAYTVNSVSSSQHLGEGPFSMTTEDEFIIVNVTVRNNDTEERMVDTLLFTLIDSQGIEYDPEAGAVLYLDSAGSFFYEDVNPGVSRTGDVVFEVREGLAGLSLQVDSGVLFAGGESVVIRLDR